MSIRATCANGHTLYADEKHAGRVGRCPKCKARVEVPVPAPAGEISEDDICSLLGDGGSAQHDADDEHVLGNPAEQPRGTGSSSTLSGSNTGSHRARVCPKCNRQVAMSYTACPHCHTYFSLSGIGEAAGMRGQPQSVECGDCGAKSFPGDTVCQNCGASLM